MNNNENNNEILSFEELRKKLGMDEPKEKVETRDFPKIFLAAFLGYFVTQLTFLEAIPEITPMHCSIISSLSPIYTM